MVRYLVDVMTTDPDKVKNPEKKDIKKMLEELDQQEYRLLKKGEKMLADLPVLEEPDSE